MKLLSVSIVMLGLGLALSASAATLTTDPLTGLPLYPATDSRLHLGNEPTRIPDSQVCKSRMQADFYVVFDSKVDTTVAWYGAHLPGFHKTHAYCLRPLARHVLQRCRHVDGVDYGDSRQRWRKYGYSRRRLLPVSARTFDEDDRFSQPTENCVPVTTG